MKEREWRRQTKGEMQLCPPRLGSTDLMDSQQTRRRLATSLMDSGPESQLSVPVTQDTWVYSEHHSVLLWGGLRPSPLTRISPGIMEGSH